jgi:hypothetical protein
MTKLTAAATTLALAALLSVGFAIAPDFGGARAKTGVGDAVRGPPVVSIEAFGPLRRLGPDALRVSVNTDKHFRWTVVLHPQDQRWAVGEFALIFEDPHHVSIWAWQTLRLQRAEYEALLAKADRMLARGDPPELQGPNAGDLVICTDYPPIYTVERRARGRTHWVRESCSSDMPAADVADLIAQTFPMTVCPYSRDLDIDVCKTSAPRDGSDQE